MSVGEALDAAVRNKVDAAVRKFMNNSRFTGVDTVNLYCDPAIRDTVAITVALIICKSKEK